MWADASGTLPDTYFSIMDEPVQPRHHNMLNTVFVDGHAKNMKADAPAGSPLERRSERVLGAVSLTALGLGGLIGAGIFVTVGVAAHEKA